MKIFKDIVKYAFFLLLFPILLLEFSCEKDPFHSNNNKSYAIDSVSYWISLSKNKNLENEYKLTALHKAQREIEREDNDSLKIRILYKIADRYLDLEEDSLFLLSNEKAYHLSIKTINYKGQAEYHWNKGTYYSNSEVLDSAFYHYNVARRLYDKINHYYYKAKMDYNMSYIQFRVKNYVESEILVISAIKGYKKLNRNFNLVLCYNRLLLLDKEIGNLEGAVAHYKTALEYLRNLDNKRKYEEKLLNNLSLVYQKQGQYDQAIEALDRALSNQALKENHTNAYATLIDNRAYCRFLNEERTEVLPDYYKALRLRDSLGNKAGVGISKMHIAEYYLKDRDSSQATTAAKEALEIAEKLGLNRDILNSLLLLSKTDPGKAGTYMDQYIRLNDSLLLEERKVRDKFTRIQFETEGYIEANEVLKKKNVWISLASLLALATISLLFFGYRQKSRNKTLLLEQQQQQANEEIYDLMLKQQNREEEGRIRERIRISEDLHDGVLARLFSVRIGMGFLTVKGNDQEGERYKLFLRELQDVEKEIRNLSHALKNDDLSSKKDFAKLLTELLEEQSEIGRFSFQMEQDNSIAWNLVDEKIKINLYRMIQEAISNILKYASCENIEMRLVRKEKSVEIFIVDDGLGFDTNKKHKGIGLKNMKSRARSIGAKIRIISQINKGTSIKVSIPTKTLYHEREA